MKIKYKDVELDLISADEARNYLKNKNLVINNVKEITDVIQKECESGRTTYKYIKYMGYAGNKDVVLEIVDILIKLGYSVKIETDFSNVYYLTISWN